MRYGLNVEPSKDIQKVKECGVIGRPQKWDYWEGEMKATQKQLDFIEVISDVVAVRFVGKTKDEASKYISDNIEEFEHAQNMSFIEWQSKYE